MKSCYSIQCSPAKLAIADLTDYYSKGMIITRINVPHEFRGKAFGSRLLHLICQAADNEIMRLWLEIQESDGLSYDQLRAWYERYEFRDVGGIFLRKPVR